MTARFDEAPQKSGLSDERATFFGITAHDLSGAIFSQTHEALANVEGRLAEIGANRSHLLVVHIWLSDMSLFQHMTAVWNAWIGSDEPPSRSCVSAKSATSGALLEIAAKAAVPDSRHGTQPIERFGMVRGNGRPTMCLGLAYGDWFTVCLIAPDCSVDIADQTCQILRTFDEYLAAVGSDRTAVQTAEIWIKAWQDVATVKRLWGEWLDSSNRPNTKIMRADMAKPEMLIEIRITASRPSRR